MSLTRGLRELIEAIPERIEVSGERPTWEVTGGSFESVVAYAEQAFGEPVVLSRRDRSRWWPRVTLTVTTDPHLAAQAPPLESLAHPEPEQQPETEPETEPEPEPAPPVAVSEPEPVGVRPSESSVTTLEAMFAYQEAARIPTQRRSSRHPQR
jgi:hypothetical protein